MVYDCLKSSLSCLLKSLYPPTCVFCGLPGAEGRDLCVACEKLLPFQENACLQCGTGLLHAASLCGRCLKKPPPFDRTRALFSFQPPVNKLIHKLKFDAKQVYARLMADLWLKRYQSDLTGLLNDNIPEYLIPVPLHPSRLRARGFNQAAVIARPLAAALGVPLDVQQCVRIRDTESQTGLPAVKRAGNVRNAFALKSPVNVKHVALVDDVMTTGSTVAALSGLLKRNGVEKVDIWIMARAGGAS